MTSPTWSFASSGARDTSNLLTAGEETAPRIGATGSSLSMPSGTLRLAFFTSRKTETITQLRMFSSSTAAGATPTLCRFGIWNVAANGDLSLIAAIANDTALFASTNTAYARNLTASWTKVAGQRYAFGALVVTAAATPTVVGCFVGTSGGQAIGTSTPRLVGVLSSQTDLPNSIPAGSLGSDANMIYGEMLP